MLRWVAHTTHRLAHMVEAKGIGVGGGGGGGGDSPKDGMFELAKPKYLPAQVILSISWR